jgi:hypothetical protein
MAIDYLDRPATDDKQVVDEQLFCALSGKPVSATEAYWAPPLVTVRELIDTVMRTGLRSPGTLGQILFAEQPNVPYAPEAREQLAARRSAEQLKLLVGLLVVIAVIAAPFVVLALR